MITRNATPVEVNGVRYRSRLEAAWAIYWLRMGLSFEYEPKRFAISVPDYTKDNYEGGYLPDFWFPLPDRDGFVEAGYLVEIKPTFPTSEELNKIKKLSESTGHACIIRFGKPGLTTFGTLKTAPGKRDVFPVSHIHESVNGRYYHHISYPEEVCSAEWDIENRTLLDSQNELEYACEMAYKSRSCNLYVTSSGVLA